MTTEELRAAMHLALHGKGDWHLIRAVGSKRWSHYVWTRLDQHDACVTIHEIVGMFAKEEWRRFNTHTLATWYFNLKT